MSWTIKAVGWHIGEKGFFFPVKLPWVSTIPGQVAWSGLQTEAAGAPSDSSRASLDSALSGLFLYDGVPPAPRHGYSRAGRASGWLTLLWYQDKPSRAPAPEAPLGEDGLTLVKEVTVIR